MQKLEQTSPYGETHNQPFSTATPTITSPQPDRPLKIALIMPRGRNEEGSGLKPLFSMALGVLVSITPRQHHVEMFDELFDDPIPYDELYDLVGITSRTFNARRAYEIADQFRRRGTKVALGGMHVSFNYDEAIQHADTVVCGEAENLWETLLNDVSKGTLKPRYDANDFPAVTDVPVIDYARIYRSSRREKVDARKSIPIYMSRGCPYSCSFCVTPDFTGRRYRLQSPDAIRQQIKAAKRVFFKKTRYGDRPWFMFTDENFGVNKKKMWEILEVVKEFQIRFSSFISVNFLEDPRTVRLLKEAGCAMALVGFETVKADALKRYGKSQNNVQKYEQIIHHCQAEGLNVQGSFVVDPAVDTYEDMDAAVQFVRKYHLMMPCFTLMTPYPGTRMYREYIEQGMVVDRDWDRYTSLNLVVRCNTFDPTEYQIQFLRHYLAMYSWGTIINRLIHCRMRLINLVTSLVMRWNLKDQVRSVEAGKNFPLPQRSISAT
jgi:bacteriochlorophyll C8 methyltransferase